ncbi:hypothetical protein C8A05DRAFT_15262 [Staphylotrichum tortipilum]|uniref:Pinin/SDK/MemA protein domain-containing protein n=1 Tax=Staphylotrichum tortipilum TaxID=2831512 RepID=A0AAN6MMK4_9PEZI|nr:hypothetical protein C8A05DRAFT_15262 [Staphylotrichum longicolle]
MAEPEAPIATKRKASPEAALEDVTGKRIKLDNGTENITPSDCLDTELTDAPDGVPAINKEQDGAHAEASPTTGEERAARETAPRQSPEARRPSVTTGPPARRSFSVEEKKRGQRLFGGLVSTLSRTTSGSQQQKRLEIERRQHEKAQQRRAEDEKRRSERLEGLKRTRQIEQIKFDERVYYLPWERTKEQEDIIDDQIFAAEEAIDRERRDFKTRKEQRFRELGVTPPPRSPSPPPRPPRERRQQTEPEREPEPASRPENSTAGDAKPLPQDADQEAGVGASLKGQPDQHEKDHDENADEMMQDEEDVVIY